MNSCFRISFSSQNPAVADLVMAKTLLQGSVATLKKKAVSGASLEEIPIFSGCWNENRSRLLRWLRLIEHAPMVFRVAEVRGQEIEVLSVVSFRRRLEFLRGIEVEQQMMADLEEGHIAAPGEFKPHDRDWTDHAR